MLAEPGAPLTGTLRGDGLVALDGTGLAAGGAGDDTYFITPVTRIVEDLTGGRDTVVLRSSMRAPTEPFWVPETIESVEVGMFEGTASIVGRMGADLIATDHSGLVAWGRGGNDVMRTLVPAVTFNGGSGDDVLTGGRGADTLGGGIGSGTICGGSGDDRIREGRGNDFVVPGAGRDRVFTHVGGEGLKESGFDPGEDRLVLEGFSFRSTHEVVAAFVRTTAGATLEAEGVTLFLLGVRAGDLSADMFELAELPAFVPPFPPQSGAGATRPAEAAPLPPDPVPDHWRDGAPAGGGYFLAFFGFFGPVSFALPPPLPRFAGRAGASGAECRP